MKKVLVIVTNFYPYVGGLERYVEGLFSRCVEHGIGVDLVCLGRNLPDHEVVSGIHVYRVRYLFTVKNVFAMPIGKEWRRTIKELLKKNEYAAVVTHTRFFYTSFLGLDIARKNRIPLIHIEHGSGPVNHPYWWIKTMARIYDLTYGKAVLKKADIVATVSKGGQDFVKKIAGRKAAIIYNGIDPEFWNPKLAKPIAKELIEWQGDRMGLVFASRINPEKNWRLLCDTIATLDKDKRKRIAIFIAGIGVDADKVSPYIASNKIQDYVRYIGLKRPEELRDFYGVCASVSLSQREGFQTTLLEAAAMNSFIITTLVGGAKEVVADNKSGIILDRCNKVELVRALNKLIARNSTRGNDRTRIVNRYNWDEAYIKFAKLLDNI